ncbi:leucyl/phenylalanyl-tRNA--protein transferase [Alcaligenaceae bacterium]|nr:leucyl/phenylalanyl-tRNA--protein transferase [Alcaligenaceae bacterium]
MTDLVWLDDSTPLPSASQAPADGLLAVGGSLSIARLTEAYSKGIFPWFNEGDPILWWSPDPRMVLHCNQLKISRSLAKKLRQIARVEGSAQASIKITSNTAFDAVIHACAAPQDHRPATWISPDIRQAYGDWHKVGQAHSVEVWMNDTLVGGLYGVCMGRFFFGESMFSLVSDASKLALAYLVPFLQSQGIQHLDCQQATAHLASLGAAPISRQEFLHLLQQALEYPTPRWGRGQLLQSGQFAPMPELAS